MIIMVTERVKRKVSQATNIAGKILADWKIGEPKQQENFVAYLFKQWQFWVILIVLLLVFVLAILNS